MKIEVLISTMNLIDEKELLKKMRIKTNSIIINQYTGKTFLKNIDKGINKLYNYNEKGLSKSRNHAIENATQDICVIADDDIKYEETYEKTIKKAYEQYPDADIIAFFIRNGKKKRKEGRIGFFSSMQIQSVQLTFKRKSIVNNKITFDERFGAGAELYMGEENLFLAQCLKKGLKIYYVPETIAEVENGNSTWFKGFNERYFEIKGATFYALSPKLSSALILQFALRKYKKYVSEISMCRAIKCMYKGKKEYKKSINKKVYMMGDFVSNTGPAIVNKSYYPYMEDRCYICRTNNKIIRILHFLIFIMKCDILLISGMSKFHVKAAGFAKKHRKKVIYLMHRI